MNTFDRYQEAAKETAIYPDHGKCTMPALAYVGLGLASEAGEIAGKIKKIMRDNNGEMMSVSQRGALVDELGDVLWYIAMLASELEIGLDYCATVNITKLKSRQERGVIGGSGDKR